MYCKLLRSAGGHSPTATLAQEEGKEKNEAHRGPRLIVRADWRLENAKIPATTPENNLDATCMGMYVVSCFRSCDAHDMSVSKFVTTELFVFRMSNRHGHVSLP